MVVLSIIVSFLGRLKPLKLAASAAVHTTQGFAEQFRWPLQRSRMRSCTNDVEFTLSIGAPRIGVEKSASHHQTRYEQALELFAVEFTANTYELRPVFLLA
jgi:hypothetical protein